MYKDGLIEGKLKKKALEQLANLFHESPFYFIFSKVPPPSKFSFVYEMKSSLYNIIIISSPPGQLLM
jgi:hypothetical protein